MQLKDQQIAALREEVRILQQGAPRQEQHTAPRVASGLSPLQGRDQNAVPSGYTQGPPRSPETPAQPAAQPFPTSPVLGAGSHLATRGTGTGTGAGAGVSTGSVAQQRPTGSPSKTNGNPSQAATPMKTSEPPDRLCCICDQE